ncbi:NAD(P)/FAD-dependent oxidoreductase [Microbulbifer pacificus]|uniref:FAD/NAD(P)-binding oxidoreductase n=1 Tax=Microbulbifer pacificus TaxID=407164 RepID=A0AAU0MXW3_9GAMM|nr:FAD/NAD(P)-binding oxidoreductase [Microbulbifer pacificus]WOX04595.1 FAD/NAD(P)-binding oxidoreductase [Microbulbifer pacificus]
MTITTKIEKPSASNAGTAGAHFDVVVVGAGSGGIAITAGLLKRKPQLKIALIDPSEVHCYQPGWTMVGGGIFDNDTTKRSMQSVIPAGANWIKDAVETFVPQENKLLLSEKGAVYYDQLIVAAGLKLNWAAVEGLPETLGKNGVTSNYQYDLAPYTWELVRSLKDGKALFTQPPMPIKCAGAPQKALYLSADHWHKNGSLDDIQVHFYNAGAVLFGVQDYVPALSSYMEKYHAGLHFGHNLVRIDGNARKAWFSAKAEDGSEHLVESDFDMIHVCPPQCAPDFIRSSPLADEAGWVDVDSATLRHKRFSNIWGLGDVTNTPNAKTAAAVRKQVPVVAENLCSVLDGDEPVVAYDGYGSCPLTVERGKIVLAEFGYGGKLLPTFPKWLNDGTKATSLAWALKAKFLPEFYWQGMLKGREWLTSPDSLKTPDAESKQKESVSP